MTCVFDENLPPKLAKALNVLEGDRGIEVLHLRERFPASTSDMNGLKVFQKSKTVLLLHKIEISKIIPMNI